MPLNKIGNKAAEPENDDPMTMDEAANYLGLSKSCLYKKTHKRQIRHYKQGKFLYFKISDLRQWAFANQVSTTDEIEAKAINYIAKNPIRRAK